MTIHSTKHANRWTINLTAPEVRQLYAHAKRTKTSPHDVLEAILEVGFKALPHATH